MSFLIIQVLIAIIVVYGGNATALASSELPELCATFTDSLITIDGKLDEPAW